MAQIPTPETLARRILAGLLDQGCRPGEGTTAQALWHSFGLTQAEDFNTGLTYAVEKGWIEVSESLFVKFTEAGFAEA